MLFPWEKSTGSWPGFWTSESEYSLMARAGGMLVVEVDVADEFTLVKQENVSETEFCNCAQGVFVFVIM